MNKHQHNNDLPILTQHGNSFILTRAARVKIIGVDGWVRMGVGSVIAEAFFQAAVSDADAPPPTAQTVTNKFRRLNVE